MLWERVSPVDRVLFDFNVKSVEWKEYFFYHIRGLRIFLLNDPMDTLPIARAKAKKYAFRSTQNER